MYNWHGQGTIFLQLTVQTSRIEYVWSLADFTTRRASLALVLYVHNKYERPRERKRERERERLQFRPLRVNGPNVAHDESRARCYLSIKTMWDHVPIRIPLVNIPSGSFHFLQRLFLHRYKPFKTIFESNRDKQAQRYDEQYGYHKTKIRMRRKNAVMLFFWFISRNLFVIKKFEENFNAMNFVSKIGWFWLQLMEFSFFEKSAWTAVNWCCDIFESFVSSDPSYANISHNEILLSASLSCYSHDRSAIWRIRRSYSSCIPQASFTYPGRKISRIITRFRWGVHSCNYLKDACNGRVRWTSFVLSKRASVRLFSFDSPSLSFFLSLSFVRSFQSLQRSHTRVASLVGFTLVKNHHRTD